MRPVAWPSSPLFLRGSFSGQLGLSGNGIMGAAGVLATALVASSKLIDVRNPFAWELMVVGGTLRYMLGSECVPSTSFAAAALSLQLDLTGLFIGAAGTAELARALAANRTLKKVSPRPRALQRHTRRSCTEPSVVA